MAGTIFFAQHTWAASSWATRFVLDFLASRAADAPSRASISELVDNNVLMLDLSDPKMAPMVDLIPDELPAHVGALGNTELRQFLTGSLFDDLYRYAREQQRYNKDPTQYIRYTIGPNPAEYFCLDDVERSVVRHLERADYVRIDVSKYTPEQRALVRNYVADLADPRVSIVVEGWRMPGSERESDGLP